ncbi:hypothetical protein [Sphingomonas sp. M1A8_2b]
MIAEPFLLTSNPLFYESTGVQLASSPVENLTNDNMDMEWGSLGLNDVYFVLRNVGAVDTVALLFSNLRPGDTLRVRAANSVSALLSAPLWDSGAIPAVVGTLVAPYTAKTLIDVPKGTQATYWRFDFSAPSNPDGQVKASRVVMGERLVIGSGIDYEWSKSVIDDSPVTTAPNYEDVQEFPSRPSVQATFGQMNEQNFNTLDAFMMRVGVKRPVLFAPEPDNLDSVQSWTVYGRMKVAYKGVNLYHNLWESDLEVAGLKA